MSRDDTCGEDSIEERFASSVKISPSLSGEDDNEVVEECNTSNIDDSSCTILCDCGYGWPKQARPRSERLRAVASQLHNFLAWRSRSKYSSKDDNGGNEKKTKKNCRVIVFAENDEDVYALKQALQKKFQRVASVAGAGVVMEDEVEFCPGNLQKVLESLNMQNFTSPDSLDSPDSQNSPCNALQQAVYLSPDAQDCLHPSAPPPTIVLVGMIVDRRIQPNRSKRRAAHLTHTCTAARLPLDALPSCLDVHENEPLNIDTVLEIMQRWWWLDSDAYKSQNGAFVEAAFRAMQTHEERHPNRVLHQRSDS